MSIRVGAVYGVVLPLGGALLACGGGSDSGSGGGGTGTGGGNPAGPSGTGGTCRNCASAFSQVTPSFTSTTTCSFNTGALQATCTSRVSDGSTVFCK